APFLSDGFDNGLAGWTVVNAGLDQTRAPPSGSAPSVRVAPNNQAADIQHSLPSTQPRVCLSAQVSVGTLPSTGSVVLLKLRTAAKASVARVVVTSAGRL